MEMTFRWYGKDDPVTLEKIRQIPGVTGIVSAIYDIPVGEAWSREKIAELKKTVEDAGLRLSVIESVPVHEDIKLGKPSRDRLIENYCQTLRNLAAEDIRVVCYNFMPVFDWTRSELDHPLPDGSNALVYFCRAGRQNGSYQWRTVPARLGRKLYQGKPERSYGRLSGNHGRRFVEQSEIFSGTRHQSGGRGAGKNGDSPRRPAMAHFWIAAHYHEHGKSGTWFLKLVDSPYNGADTVQRLAWRISGQ